MSTKNFFTYNPHDQSPLQEFEHLSIEEVQPYLEKAQKAFEAWRRVGFSERAGKLIQLQNAFRNEKEKLAQLMTLEMGKPLAQSRAEVDKSSKLIDFIITAGPEALKGRKTSTYEIVPQPLGLIYGVMPWNFPLWQVVRFALPAMMAGNGILLKHADGVAGSAALIGKIFNSVVDDLFTNLPIDHKVSDQLIEDPRVRAVSLTGSTRAGKAVAAQAGKNLKKCVLELGGNDAYVILPDADLEFALQKTFEARSLNAGQSCISAKRLFVQEEHLDTVLGKLKAKVHGIQLGNPLEESSTMGPLARMDLKKQLQEQLALSLKEGAEIYYQMEITTEQKAGAYFPPTILYKITEKNSAFREEFFGPVFSVITYKNEEEALRLANASMYGLGGAVFSKSYDKAHAFALEMETGSVAINDFFRSAPEKPFGGVKNSGYGRELGSEGFHEFVNIKTLIIPSGTPVGTVQVE